MPIVYIGLGSNIGDREDHLAFGLRALQGLGKITKGSSLYETEAVCEGEHNDFLNMVVELDTSLSAEELLAYCLAIQEQRRTEKSKDGSKELDLDILLYDCMITCKKDLIVPHPRMHERNFVLIPLNEVAPDAIHPPTQQPIRELLARCTDTHKVEKYTIDS